MSPLCPSPHLPGDDVHRLRAAADARRGDQRLAALPRLCQVDARQGPRQKRPFAADLRPHAFVRGARPEPLRSLVEEQMVEQELKRSSQPAYRHHTNQQQPSPPPPPPPPAPMGRTASGGRVAAAAAAARDWSSSSSFNGGTAEPAAAARGHKPHVERDLDVRDVFDTADIAT